MLSSDLNEFYIFILDITYLINYIMLFYFSGAKRQCVYQGIGLWFSCTFPDLCKEKPRIVLETSPFTNPTHWKQTIIVLPEERNLAAGEPIAFQLDLKRNPTNVRR